MRNVIEVIGLPGSGKTTFVSSTIMFKKQIYTDCENLIAAEINPSKTKTALNYAYFLFRRKTAKGLFFYTNVSHLQDTFALKQPVEYDFALDYFSQFLRLGFRPSSRWINSYFNAWLAVSLATKSNKILIHDEGIGQRLLDVLRQINLSDDQIEEYMSYADQLLITDTDINTCITRAQTRESHRQPKEVELWVKSYKKPLNRLKNTKNIFHKTEHYQDHS